MCVPGTYEKMAQMGRRDFLRMTGAAAVGALALGLNEKGSAAAAESEAPSLDVGFSAISDGSLVTYTITLRNESNQPIEDIFIAGVVPGDASFERVIETPDHTWFRGFEAAGTSFQSAVWLAEGVPAGGSVGPFRYQVVAKAPAISAHAWVAWNRPARGEARSRTVAQPVALQSQAFPFSNLLDLTHPLTPAFPVFPAFQPLQLTNVFRHEEHGFYANALSMPEHCGTHMDAPIHFAEGKMDVAEIPVENLIVPAVVVHIHDRAASNPDAQLTLADLQEWERRHGPIPAGAAVLMHSGWESRLGNLEAYLNADEKGTMHFPGFHREATDFLLEERNVRGIGVDTISLDYGASSDFAVHYSWLGTNRWGLENLANLTRIPPRGATLVVAPMKLANGSGAPTRVLAMW